MFYSNDGSCNAYSKLKDKNRSRNSLKPAKDQIRASHMKHSIHVILNLNLIGQTDKQPVLFHIDIRRTLKLILRLPKS